MKVKVVSDLHLECCEQGHGVPDLGKGDVLILGGDILCARHFKTDGKLHQVYDEFLRKCVENFDEVIYIAGNHEAYGYNYESTWNVLADNLPKEVHLLENDFVKIKDWVFLGCTLWTDFHNENPLEMMEAGRLMNDYKTIRITSKYRKMNPDDTIKFHKKSKQFLLEKLDQFCDHKIWVLTHHGPSYQSVHSKYRTETINGAYVSDLDDLILSHPQIKYWHHGHTHTSFDYKIGDCRVVCNPRGYYNGYNTQGLNLDFNPNFEVEL